MPIRKRKLIAKRTKAKRKGLQSTQQVEKTMKSAAPKVPTTTIDDELPCNKELPPNTQEINYEEPPHDDELEPNFEQVLLEDLPP
ncbi:unnamed protein product [Cylindrotheca closterium]|uniref:Uncharacterized protein n=1 Tax=Cylindrotheca closterium TaxID=2856 RepID=A0AAD2CHI5_9STRA|nr:unnamed protein product [Cylindrotheca closterium]